MHSHDPESGPVRPARAAHGGFRLPCPQWLRDTGGDGDRAFPYLGSYAVSRWRRASHVSITNMLIVWAAFTTSRACREDRR